MAKAQKIVIHVHEGKKLFHVSLNNADRLDSMISWKAVAGKARYAYENLIQGKRSDNERGLTGGLVMAMVNTDYSGWYTHHDEVGAIEHMVRAVERKDQLVAEWEARGYTNVGVRNSTSKSDPSNWGQGSKWTVKFNVKNMTRDKIYSKIEFINISLQMDIPQGVKSAAYFAVAGANATVDNMATLLQFIRGKMGLV